ncbi:uncharacterized protein EI90DRAFT_1113655 [Cantharellus anzutake]|uniref:uncharacterized protein n=1 Tax=Cantharellus anzutake TaxID=1750568 RepID=UPI00190628D3|nr:uncharacterized protein EI90DRAFT_1113655 [Cantharellus anzutake]KAF8310905.1 hypothetical protein EI90DRAFT_1113655 [Cantharellus anzutake]
MSVPSRPVSISRSAWGLLLHFCNSFSDFSGLGKHQHFGSFHSVPLRSIHTHRTNIVSKPPIGPLKLGEGTYLRSHVQHAAPENAIPNVTSTPALN